MKWILMMWKKLWDAKWNLYHTSSTKCKSRSSKVWTVKNTHRLSAWYDKNLAWLWECCLFVCMFVLGHTSIYETITVIGITERPDHATFSLAKSMNFPVFGNADTQSANHKKSIFTPIWELHECNLCCLQFPNSFPEKEFFSALQPELTLVGWITI